MPLRSKVIITCAVTGSIHTPTMSPYPALDPGRGGARRDRRRRGRRRDPAFCMRATRRTGGQRPIPEVFMQFLPRIKQATKRP